jgi:hypothetical protein
MGKLEVYMCIDEAVGGFKVFASFSLFWQVIEAMTAIHSKGGKMSVHIRVYYFFYCSCSTQFTYCLRHCSQPLPHSGKIPRATQLR